MYQHVDPADEYKIPWEKDTPLHVGVKPKAGDALSALFRSSSLLLKNRNTLEDSKLFAKKEEAKSKTEYWQGEWVCADCGYVYDRDIDGGGLYFEQQKKGFICPQCSAPRKRYAKKVGDQWVVTKGSKLILLLLLLQW
jgi:rubredoxin